MALKLLVYFDGQFWSGLVEKTENGTLMSSRVVFGSLPKESELIDFVLEKLDFLPMSPPLSCETKLLKKFDPKRLRRLARREAQTVGPASKSRDALKRLEEERLAARQAGRRELRETDRESRFNLKQLKKKEKRKGR